MFKRYWWILLVMVPAGGLVGLLIGAAVTYVLPKMYESECVVEVRPSPGFADNPGSPPVAPGPQFLGTEFEKIKSRNSLEMVIDNLELTNRWAVDQEQAIGILKRIVTTRNIPGTDLISIRVRHTNQVDTRDVAREVANAYRAYRAQIEGSEAERRLDELNRMVRDQEDVVEERRKVLATIVRTKGIIYRGSDTDDGQPAANQSTHAALQAYHALEQEKMQIESQINSLLKYDGDQLMVYAAGLHLPDNVVRTLYPQYLEAKRQLQALRVNGLGDEHPTAVEAQEQIDLLKGQLDEAVVNLRATLRAQLDLTEERLKQAADARDPAAALTAGDYVDAKREFESDQALLQEMKLRQMSERIRAKVLPDAVLIHEEPVISRLPVSPNVTLNLVLGTAAGILISPLLALPLMWLLGAGKKGQRGETRPPYG